MNVIYINTHDIGRYIEPYGYNIPAPNLMQFAKEGVLFRHTYCAGPTCSPSRAGILTGQCAHSSGMLGLAHRGFSLTDPTQHLANFLKRNGYETTLVGGQHEVSHKGGSVQSLGYEQHINGNGDEASAQAAADYLRSKKDQKQPFYMAFGMGVTHRDFPQAPPDINPNYVIPPYPLYDTAENRKDTADYIYSVRLLDKCVGIVMDAIHEVGLDKNSLIFFTTDHGVAMPNMKCTLYDTGIGVALMMQYPGNKSKGTALDSIVSQIDVFPSICDILGLDHPDYLQGTSLLPLLDGEKEKVRDEIFSEVNYHALYEPVRCIRTDRYKLIKRYDYHTDILPGNVDPGYSKEFLIENGWLERPRPREELFDLYLDPTERVNLTQDSGYTHILRDLNERLHMWMVETNDPLLQAKDGRIATPKGAKINVRTARSARENEFESW